MFELMNHLIKDPHVSKSQTPHLLIISILIKRHRFFILLLSRLAFLITIVSFVQSFVPSKFIYCRSYTNYNKEEFENNLK